MHKARANGVTDILVGLLGALTAYMLVCHSFIIKKQEDCSNSNEKNARVDLRAVMRVSDKVLKRMKDVIDSMCSEGSAEDVSKEVVTHQLTRTNKAC